MRSHGVSKPREIAIIEEDKCIGCTLCILACPVDAILGASKSMHTVILEECTGCELCIEPCPVDCIKMEPPDMLKITNQLKIKGLPWQDLAMNLNNNEF